MHESSRKTALLILYLATLQQLVPMVATFHVPGIEKYIVTRRGKSETDLFRVVYSNSNCPEGVCESSGATANVFHSVECRCDCKPEYPTFLPELGNCSDTVTVKKTLFKSSSVFFEWSFFLRSLDLKGEGYERLGNSEDYHSCQVPQTAAYYNYQAQTKWVEIHSDVFNIAIKGNQTVFKWSADGNKELLGRIIRVKISCSFTDPRPPRTAFLVFKASGEITYNLHGVDYSRSGSSSLIVSPSASSVLLLPSSSPSAVTSPQLSTQTTSILLHPSSSLLSPQPHQTKYVSWTTAVPSLVTSRTVHIEPSGSSSAITARSSSVAVITGNGPGNNSERSTGNGSNKAVIIGAAGGCAVVLVLLIAIIVSYKRRKLRANNNETTTKCEDNDIQLGRTKANNLTIMSEQDSNPTYQGLVIERGQMNGVALHTCSSSKDTSYSYDNFTVYQNLDEKAPETSVYQSLKKEQHATGKPDPKPRPRATGHLSNSAKVIAEPRPSATEHLSNRAKVIAEPVYGNGIKLPDTEQGNMPEPLYNVLEESEPEGQYEAPKRDDFGDTQGPLYNVLEDPGPEKDDYGASESVDTQDPIYNVLEGPEAEENNYEFQDVGSGGIEQEPMYVNVLKGPETEQAPEEPLYTGLEGSDAQNGSQGSRESLYSPLEGPISDGANKSSVDLTALKLPFYLAAFDNPAFEESLEQDVGYGVVVRKPGPKTTCKRESVYEPLRGPDLYQALRKSTV